MMLMIQMPTVWLLHVRVSLSEMFTLCPDVLEAPFPSGVGKFDEIGDDGAVMDAQPMR